MRDETRINSVGINYLTLRNANEFIMRRERERTSRVASVSVSRLTIRPDRAMLMKIQENVLSWEIINNSA